MNSTGTLLRRHALDLIDEALATDDVHEMRKRLKELRAVTDLLRARLPHHGREDRTAFRNAARRLAGARDAEAALEAFDALGATEFGGIRAALACRSAVFVDVRVIDESLVAARRRVAAWPVDGMHDDDVLSSFRRSYRRARNAMAAALESGTPELFHEWRKRAKTLWYEARMLEDDSAKDLHRLSRILGDHHDLAVLLDLLPDSPDAPRLRSFIDQRMRSLETEAAALGHDLFSRRGPKRAERAEKAAARTAV